MFTFGQVCANEFVYVLWRQVILCDWDHGGAIASDLTDNQNTIGISRLSCVCCICQSIVWSLWMHCDVAITSRKDKIEAVKFKSMWLIQEMFTEEDRSVGKKRTLG